MIFRPVWPHQYCNGRINVQGVFMKRQREASQKMAELICSLAAQDMARKEALPPANACHKFPDFTPRGPC